MNNKEFQSLFLISLVKDNTKVNVRRIWRWLNILEWIVLITAAIIFLTTGILLIIYGYSRTYSALFFASIPIVALDPVNAYKNAKAITKLKKLLADGFLPATPYDLLKAQKMLKSYNVKDNYFS